MPDTDYARIERAIRFIEANVRRRPSLDEIAAGSGLSPFHFQRLFRRWAGISPKRFIQYLTASEAERALRASASLLEAADEAGLSGPGRLHDLIVAIHAVTPGEFKRFGAGLTIRYGVHPSPFGDCLLAATDRGVCWLSFIDPGDRDSAVADLRDYWRGAAIQKQPDATRPVAERIFRLPNHGGRLDLFVHGTNFQIKVWEALLTIPPGAVASYREIARRIGAPKATRSVGTAVGRNPISYLIPCHRVIRTTGAFGHYGGGAARKKALLGWEAARHTELMIRQPEHS
ncbi:MAG TPA: methylated-DNA--[protein]-cysteine S-methyltransferase [Nitrospiria bacterium]|nr:methylated-DNA--[protein]-cysteine S-methyltransferase [Nitrospiria bacterium]